MNFLTLGAAIATRYSTVTPPTGFRALQMATATPPNAISNTPSLVVWPTSGDLILQPGQQLESNETLFDVEFYYAKTEADIVRESRAMQLWLGTLIAHWFTGSLSLSLAASLGVSKVLPTSWEIVPLPYAGVTFDGIRIRHTAWWRETVTVTA